MQGSIRKHGDIYYYRISLGKINGKYKVVERRGSKDKAETEQMLRKAISELEECGQIFTPSKITFSEYLDLWLSECCEGQIRHGTYLDYKNVIRHIKKSDLCNMRLSVITPDHLQKYINDKARTLAKSTMKSHYVVLNQSLKYAVYPKHFIRESPFQYIIKPQFDKNINAAEDDERTQIITVTEFQDILSMLPDFYIELPFQIAMHTGMREGEICALCWNDIDLKSGTITVKKNLFYNSITKSWEVGKTKTGTKRVIDIGQTLIDILKKARKMQMVNQVRYGEFYIKNYLSLVDINGYNHLQIKTYPDGECQESNFVCVHENGSLITTQYIKTIITRKIRKGGNGIDFHFHMLRHTHATMLIENGANIKDVQERLGHSKIATTMDTYSHVTPKMRKETVDIFEKAFG